MQRALLDAQPLDHRLQRAAAVILAAGQHAREVHRAVLIDLQTALGRAQRDLARAQAKRLCIERQRIGRGVLPGEKQRAGFALLEPQSADGCAALIGGSAAGKVEQPCARYGSGDDAQCYVRRQPALGDRQRQGLRVQVEVQLERRQLHAALRRQLAVRRNARLPRDLYRRPRRDRHFLRAQHCLRQLDPRIPSSLPARATSRSTSSPSA